MYYSRISRMALICHDIVMPPVNVAKNGPIFFHEFCRKHFDASYHSKIVASSWVPMHSLKGRRSFEFRMQCFPGRWWVSWTHATAARGWNIDAPGGQRLPARGTGSDGFDPSTLAAYPKGYASTVPPQRKALVALRRPQAAAAREPLAFCLSRRDTTCRPAAQPATASERSE